MASIDSIDDGNNVTMSFGKAPSFAYQYGRQPSTWTSEQPSRDYQPLAIGSLLNQNNQLKSAMVSQRQLIGTLKEQLKQHQYELQQLSSSKKDIAASVQNVSKYNQAYLDLLHRKDAEITRLKHQLSSVRGQSKDQTETSATVRITQSRQSCLQSGKPRRDKPSPYEDNYLTSPRESRRSGSLLKDVKRFVRDVNKRLNSPGKPFLSPKHFKV